MAYLAAHAALLASHFASSRAAASATHSGPPKRKIIWRWTL